MSISNRRGARGPSSGGGGGGAAAAAAAAPFGAVHGRRLVHRRPLARLARADRAERVDKLDQGAVLRPPVLRLAHLAARAAATGRRAAGRRAA